MRSITVVRGGMLTTVQDLGRWGQQHVGIPVAGPMDWYSHRLANRIVGNPDDAAALEVTLVGPDLTCDTDMTLAVCGATFDVTADGEPLRNNTASSVRRGTRIRFGARRAGARATFAVRGGIDVPVIAGSRATSLISRMGPFGGRAVGAGDVLPVGVPTPGARPAGRALALPAGGGRLRIIWGPHAAVFSEEARLALQTTRYIVTPDSNRMGYRLDGAVLARIDQTEMLSDATPIGSLQVPTSGLPILLMADRQTTGGYPKIATVITADLPIAGQLAPGDWIEFVPCTRQAAVEALRRREAALSGVIR